VALSRRSEKLSPHIAIAAYENSPCASGPQVLLSLPVADVCQFFERKALLECDPQLGPFWRKAYWALSPFSP
jgi:hypothetical protein